MSLFTHAIIRNKQKFFRIKYYCFACDDVKNIISHDRNLKERKFLIFECEIMLYALCQNLLCSSGSGSFTQLIHRRSILSLHARAVSDTGFPGVSLPNSTLRTLTIGSNSLCLITWREATSVDSSRSCFCSGHRKGRAMIFKGNVKDRFDMRAASLDFSCLRTALNQVA